MSSDKEKQHYVPKFYLRNFSCNKNKKQIGVFNVNNKLFIKSGKLKTQAYKPFYYGKDGEMEEILADSENKIAPVIAYLNHTKILPDKRTSVYKTIVFFTILTQVRTPVTSKSIIGRTDELLKAVQSIAPAIGKLPDDVGIIQPEEAILLALTGVKLGMVYIKDLECKLLINKTTIPFITSDNPVAKYNQFLEQRKWDGGWTGYGCKGLQIFLPISPDITLLFYDKDVYKVGEKKQMALEITDENDISALNLLQIINCDANLFFNDSITEQYMYALFKKSEKYNKANIPRHKLYDMVSQDRKENSNIVALGVTNPEINLRIAGISITKHAKKHKLDNRAVQLRPYALALAEKEREKNDSDIYIR